MVEDVWTVGGSAQLLLRVDSCQRPTTAWPSQPKNTNTAMPSSDDSTSAPYVSGYWLR